MPELDSAHEKVDYETRLPMTALLTLIVFWLSAEFGLPAIYEHPRVEFAPPAKIASLRYRGFASWRLEAAPSLSGQRVIVSVCDDATKTIYLPEGWTGPCLYRKCHPV